LSVTNASYEVLASQGNTYLGGDDLDHRLAEMFVTHLRDQHNVDPGTNKIVQARLRLLSEQTKIRLSSDTVVHLKEPIVMGSDTYLLDLTITRDDFEQLIDDLVISTIEKATQALADAGVTASSLNRLLLVGGSTRIPLITERLVQHLGIEPESWLDPDLSVAMGASVRGAIANGEVFERSVVDICPHSLGIAVFGEEDSEFSPSLFDSDNPHPLTFAPLIRRNSRLPAHFVRTFYKGSDHQQHAIVAVYQGESSNTRQNTFIGEFTVTLQNQHDAKLDVSFTYDLNGTINISVKEAGSLQARVYTMDLSRSADDNSDLNGFSEQLLMQEESALTEDNPEVTNYLIEKVSKRLQEQGSVAPQSMRDLLESYKLLLEQDSDDELDEVEDQLYDWIESE
jgi:molecular chaperone DnaK